MALSHRTVGLIRVMIGIVVICMAVSTASAAWGFGGEDHGKVKLKDVQVLTLKDGKMTTGHRSSPVPQLNCVGGSAQGKFRPQVVQCKNMGWDGQDVQWECKSDMDNLYRFGEIEVLCEGYDYPEDPYITKGSCGLEYTLEYTKEGHDRQKKGHDYGYSSSQSNNYGSSHNYGGSSGPSVGKWSGIGDLVVLAVVGIVIYALYKTCLTNQEMGDRQYSSTDGDHPAGGGGGGGWSNPNQRGPGPNVHGYNDDASCGAGNNRRNHGTGGGGGFWTGMGAGGLLGYMLGGNRGGGNYMGYGNRGYGNRNYGSTWGTGGGFGGGGGGGGFGGGSSSSSGTRTASGFGGTRRR